MLLVLVAPVWQVWRESWSRLKADSGVQDRKAWSEISLARIDLFTCWMFLTRIMKHQIFRHITLGLIREITRNQ